MAKIYMHIGTGMTDTTLYDFESASPEWVSVKSQIEAAAAAGYGFVTIPASSRVPQTTYLYNSTTHVRWTEAKS